MQIIFIAIYFWLLLLQAACDNPSNKGGSPGAYIEGSTFVHPAIMFSVTYPSTWLLTMDTIVGGVHYNLYAKKPLTDSVISMITIITGIHTTNTDSIMTAEEHALSQSLEGYTTVSKTGGFLGYNYSADSVLYIGEKIFTIKGEYLVILSFSILAYPFTETALVVRDIISSMTFE